MSEATPPAITERCPRCGGVPAPQRKVSRFNPFLPNPKIATCSDCGLTYPLPKAEKPAS